MEVKRNSFPLNSNGALPKSKPISLNKDVKYLDNGQYTEPANQTIKEFDTPSNFVKEIKAAIQNWAGSRVIRYSFNMTHEVPNKY